MLSQQAELRSRAIKRQINIMLTTQSSFFHQTKLNNPLTILSKDWQLVAVKRLMCLAIH
jgi:hypothetical protein